MKRFLFAAVIACLTMITSCGVSNVHHTGDLTGSIYGVWALDSKAIAPANSVGNRSLNQVDYSGVHFYLSLSEPRIALAKKGSFTDADLEDVDVKAGTFTYNADLNQISFLKTIILTDELLTKSMTLSGTFDVVELGKSDLVIKQKSNITGITTIYAYKKN